MFGLIELFKLCKGHTSLPIDRFFQIDTDRRTRGHSLKICKLCHKDIRKHFFSVRVINRWNSSSEEVIQPSSVYMFKWHLQKVRERRMASSWTTVRYPDGRIFISQWLETGATAPGELSGEFLILMSNSQSSSWSIA